MRRSLTQGAQFLKGKVEAMAPKKIKKYIDETHPEEKEIEEEDDSTAFYYSALEAEQPIEEEKGKGVAAVLREVRQFKENVGSEGIS